MLNMVLQQIRIGAAYLSAGAGFGGENFSHDILTLSSTVSKTGIKSRLLEQVWEINEQQKKFYSVNYGIIIIVI